MDISIQGYTEGKDYVETFDSPQKTREKITRKIMARHEIGEALFDAILDMHGQNGLDASQCSFQSGIYDTIQVVFVRDTSSVIAFTTGDKTENSLYSADANAMECRLEELRAMRKYRMCWNHNLYECVPDGQGITLPLPLWIEADEDGSHADGIQYLWAYSQPASAPEGSGWREVYHRTKAADTFIRPSLIVHERRYFRTEKAAESAVQKVGTLQAPGKTYGKTSDQEHWLIMKSSVSPDGGIYVLQTDYQFAVDGWDGDLYS